MPTLSEIENEIAELNRKKEAIICEEKKDIINQVRGLIRQYNLTAADLALRSTKGGLTKAPREPRPITFRDPETGDTWDGRLEQKGRKPDWIVAKIKSGTIDQYRV